MSVPRNNLAELLKRKEQNALGSPQVYTPPPRTRSGPKFKPAISTPSGPSTSISSSGLPAFSTPGFRQAKPSPILTTTSEPIVISDYSNPETPHPLKRNSSDPDVVPDPSPQAFKRPKRAVIASDKENRPPPKVTSSSSKETTPTYVSQLASKAVASPSPSSSMNQSASRPAWMEAHVDLMEVSQEDLKNSKSRQHELLNTVMRLLLDGIGTTIPGDTKRFTSLRKDIEQRIEAIDWVFAQRKGKQRDMTTASPTTFSSNQPPPNSQPISTPTISTPSITNPSVQLPPELSISSISSATFPARSTNADNLTRDRVIEVDDDIEIDTPPTRPQEPDSDAELWDSFEIMPDVAIDTDVRASPTKAAITAAPIDHSRRITTGTYMEEVYHQLEFVFGLKEFRPNQLEAISATLEGKDVFVLMPTGGGKSLCYQLPAVCTSGKTCGVTIVVSPLTALMEDQVSALTAKGVDAFFWSADSLQHEVSAKLFSGDKKPSLLYVTPEKLRASSSCRNLLERLYRQQQLARFAIDEAHCISTWGQDFRSAYQGLGQLRQDYPNVPIIALTATANERTRDDIVDQLRLRNPASFNQSFNRPNLKYYIEKKTKVLDSIVDFIQRKHPNSSGVIYCLSRRSCQNLTEQLQSKGLRAEYFHAGLDKDTKNRLLEEWKKDKFRIIVATIAFGMGIDKPDVRFVIHHDLPKSLSGYYQETGRAGRDGKPADCVLYYSYKDFLTICWMIENDNDPERTTPPDPGVLQRGE
ncbi:hypothetical protein NP233_g2250 [Leucocoprinus birnbaumii]|uniref:DNA 3'-5' helicase n=1 Tax=Leucocoprinus birnbaumii TaxID=56174 RepID=A0AAD5VZ83_9AGAR|nr:hypothetical protein NP233_g2250 [Leucocoprinus birnbaumii]